MIRKRHGCICPWPFDRTKSTCNGFDPIHLRAQLGPTREFVCVGAWIFDLNAVALGKLLTLVKRLTSVHNLYVPCFSSINSPFEYELIPRIRKAISGLWITDCDGHSKLEFQTDSWTIHPPKSYRWQSFGRLRPVFRGVDRLLWSIEKKWNIVNFVRLAWSLSSNAHRCLPYSLLDWLKRRRK